MANIPPIKSIEDIYIFTRGAGRKAHMLETEVVRRVYAEVNRLTA